MKQQRDTINSLLNIIHSKAPVFAYWQINSCRLNFVISLTGRPEAGERDYSFHVVKVKWLFGHWGSPQICFQLFFSFDERSQSVRVKKKCYYYLLIFTAGWTTWNSFAELLASFERCTSQNLLMWKQNYLQSKITVDASKRYCLCSEISSLCRMNQDYVQCAVLVHIDTNGIKVLSSCNVEVLW